MDTGDMAAVTDTEDMAAVTDMAAGTVTAEGTAVVMDTAADMATAVTAIAAWLTRPMVTATEVITGILASALAYTFARIITGGTTTECIAHRGIATVTGRQH